MKSHSRDHFDFTLWLSRYIIDPNDLYCKIFEIKNNMKNTLSAIRNAHEKNSELKKMIVDHIDAYKNVSLALGADSTLKKILFIIMFVWFINVINNLFDANLCVNTWIPANLIDL